jgi:hypothetical protein
MPATRPRATLTAKAIWRLVSSGRDTSRHKSNACRSGSPAGGLRLHVHPQPELGSAGRGSRSDAGHHCPVVRLVRDADQLRTVEDEVKHTA